MKKNKNQGEGFIPEISRRQFIQAGSALAALPLVVTTRTVQAQDAAATRARRKKKWCKPAARLTAGGSVIFELTSAKALSPVFPRARIMHWIRRCRLCVPAFVAERIGNLFIIPIGLNIQ